MYVVPSLPSYNIQLKVNLVKKKCADRNVKVSVPLSKHRLLIMKTSFVIFMCKNLETPKSLLQRAAGSASGVSYQPIKHSKKLLRNTS